MTRSLAMWQALKPEYRRRLEVKGITRELYVSGIPLSAARGHATTPERPNRALSNPIKYAAYLNKATPLTPEAAADKFLDQIQRAIDAGAVTEDNLEKLDESGVFVLNRLKEQGVPKDLALLSYEDIQARARKASLENVRLKKQGKPTIESPYFYHAG